MKRRFFVGVIGLFCFSANAGIFKRFSRSEVVSHEDALEVALKEDKHVYLLFKGRSCPWCERQAEELKKEAMVETMNGMVFCEVKVQDRKDLAHKYGVSSIPAHRLLDPNGEVVRSHVGFMESEKLIEFLSH